MKLNIGCSDTPIEGYVNCDIRWRQCVDSCFDAAKDPWPFPDSSVEEVLCERTLEHLTPLDHPHFFAQSMRVLAPNGSLQIAVPNMIVVMEQALHDAKNIPLGYDPTGVQVIEPYEHWEHDMVSIYSRLDGNDWTWMHQWGFCEAYLIKMFERHGFVNVGPCEPQTPSVVRVRGFKP